MAMTCNIDSRGKLARLIYGIILVILAIALAIFWARGSGSILRWSLTGVCVLMGGFAVFEARAGWCAMRAIGIKTPM